MNLPIPVTVLTGFLGAGKTTLLKRLLNRAELSGTAVIVNEFGEVGLDDALIEAAEEDVVLLPSGCICCAVRGDLVAALKRLADRAMGGEIANLTRIVIETSGLADPAPIAHTLMTEEDLFRLYALDGIVTLVDAELGLRSLDQNFEPAKQIAVADVVVLTKTDRADAAQRSTLERRIRRLNRTAPVIAAVSGDIDPAALFGLQAFEPAAIRGHARDWLGIDGPTNDHDEDDHHHHVCGPGCDHEHHHDHDAPGHLHGVTSFCLTFDEPLDGRKLSFALELLRSMHGEKLLRIKGIVAIAGEAQPFVVHGVQHVFYPPATLEAWPSEDHRSRIVFITRGLAQVDVHKVLSPLFDPRAEAASYAGWTAD